MRGAQKVFQRQKKRIIHIKIRKGEKVFVFTKEGFVCELHESRFEGGGIISRPNEYYLTAINKKNATRKFKKYGFTPVELKRFPRLLFEGETVFHVEYGRIMALEVKKIEGSELTCKVVSDSAKILRKGAEILRNKDEIYQVKLA